MVKKGFTLVEIIISFAVFSIICIPIINILLKSTQTDRYTSRVKENGIYAQYVMEKLMCENTDLLAEMLHGKNQASLYTLIDFNDAMAFDQGDRTLYKDKYTYYKDYVKPDETYEEIIRNFSCSEDDFEGVVRVVLSYDDENVLFICVSVWDKYSKDTYKSTLVSMRRM